MVQIDDESDGSAGSDVQMVLMGQMVVPDGSDM